MAATITANGLISFSYHRVAVRLNDTDPRKMHINFLDNASGMPAPKVTDVKKTRRWLLKLFMPEDVEIKEKFTPPQSAQPFLPKVPRDIKLDYFVKIITAEGRVMVGKVRYVGPVTGKSEVHVGVELPKNTGDSDGAFQGFRYFDCDPDRAVFVPFKKVVMAWSI